MDFDYFEEGQPRNAQEEHRRRVNHQIHQRFRLRDTEDALAMAVTEFVRIYRMPQHDVVRLVNILAPYMPQHTSPQQTDLLTKVLASLSFFASGHYQRTVGRTVDVSVSQTSISRYLKEVVTALNHPEILSRFIHFPANRAERAEVIARNERLGMPRVLGFIDGTLIRIVPPLHRLHREAYFCRKRYTAINAQIICDAQLNILDVDARFPGSCNDQYIWNGSAARRVMEQAYNEDRCWLLGDSGYFRLPWLHIPLLHAAEGTPEFHYTQLHTYCRNAVERCIGVLKGRWRCLCNDRAITYRDPTYIGYMINACCVLHNYCLSRGVPNPAPFIEVAVDVNPPDEPEDLSADLGARGLAEQQYLINYAHNRRLQ